MMFVDTLRIPFPSRKHGEVSPSSATEGSSFMIVTPPSAARTPPPASRGEGRLLREGA